MSLSRRLASEVLGTALLLSCVVGSEIMGERLAAGNVAIALLANTAATGAVRVALILDAESAPAREAALEVIDDRRRAAPLRREPGA